MGGGPFDTIFLNGSVFTGLHDAPVAAAVALRGAAVAAVGDPAELRAAAGRQAEVVDLAGGLLLAGFRDAHVHPVWGGLHLLRCDLHELRTREEYLAAVVDYAAGHRHGGWVLGGGWGMSAFPGGLPHRRELDRLVPDRPVFLTNRDEHGAWVNSRALEMAAVDAGTPDPPGGRIERDEAGRPTGVLHERAVDLVAWLVPAPPPAELDAALALAERHLFRYGITGWHDAILGAYGGYPDTLEPYLRAARSRTLRARATGALWWDRDRGPEQVPDLVERREAARSAGLDVRTVKIMQDGIVESLTAAVLEPYLDAAGRPTAGTGLSFLDPAALTAAVAALDGAGFDVHVHALGDRAVREALDAVEAARAANGPGGRRHRFAHLQVVQPQDVPRFAALGVLADIQPLWACHEPQMDHLCIPVLGAERSRLQYPFAALAAAGAGLACGSDWPVTSPDPLLGVHVAVTRLAPPQQAAPPAGPFLPEQAVDLATAVRAYTAGSAYADHLESRSGTVQAGRDADLVVLDRDPFAGPAEEIAAARVRRVYVGGAPVHLDLA